MLLCLNGLNQYMVEVVQKHQTIFSKVLRKVNSPVATYPWLDIAAGHYTLFNSRWLSLLQFGILMAGAVRCQSRLASSHCIFFLCEYNGCALDVSGWGAFHERCGHGKNHGGHPNSLPLPLAVTLNTCPNGVFLLSFVRSHYSYLKSFSKYF